MRILSVSEWVSGCMSLLFGGTAIECAARWVKRLLLLSPLGQILWSFAVEIFKGNYVFNSWIDGLNCCFHGYVEEKELSEEEEKEVIQLGGLN